MKDVIAKFRQTLQNGKKCFGVGITFADPLVSEALGDSVDFLWIDLEHSTMSPEIANGHMLAARSTRVPALVRVPQGLTHLIKSALDGGADGIIVPQVYSVEEVTSIVADCRYPPVGRRGFGPRVPSNYGRSGGQEYVDDANANIFVTVMIETAQALEQVEAIAAVPGLDSLVIGPADLSMAIGEGRNVNSLRTEAAIRRIVAAAHSNGKFVGAGMGVSVEFALKLAKSGVQWLQVGQDFDHMIHSIDELRSSFNARRQEFE